MVMVVSDSQRGRVRSRVCTSGDTGLRVRGHFCANLLQIWVSFLFQDLAGKGLVNQSQLNSK